MIEKINIEELTIKQLSEYCKKEWKNSMCWNCDFVDEESGMCGFDYGSPQHWFGFLKDYKRKKGD